MKVIGRMADLSGFSRNPKPPALAGGEFTNIIVQILALL